MRKLLTILIVGGTLVTASGLAAAQDRIGFNFTVVAPGVAVSVGQPTFVSVPFYGVVAPYAYEYGTPVYYRPVPRQMMTRAVYSDHRHQERMDRRQW